MEISMKREVTIGKIKIGNDNPVAVQSMCTAKTADIASVTGQIAELERAGCEIIRVAVPDMESAESIYEIKNKINIPLVADIHFDYRLALKCIEQGVDKIRINPGNIGDIDRVRAVVNAAKAKHIPIRIGVNSGSIDGKILEKYKKPCAEALVESAMEHVKILESLDFYDTVISLKASNVPLTIESYRLINRMTDYPLHLGVTESGTMFSGSIKSAIGIGSLLYDGIGNTIRVSLTDDPVREVEAGIEILKALGIRQGGINIISCPTCARCGINLIEIANRVTRVLSGNKKNLTVAIMGCAVNGPGEARDADIGVAGGKGEAILFKKGEIVRKIKEENIIEELLKEIELCEEK